MEEGGNCAADIQLVALFKRAEQGAEHARGRC